MSTTVILIRHAEKVDPRDGAFNVGLDGRARTTGLSVRGWQRAGALVPLFTPQGAPRRDPRLATPMAIYAASDRPRSHRPTLTVGPLAEALGLPVQSAFRSGRDEEALLTDALAIDGPVLVCWRHDDLPRFVRTLVGGDTPLRWASSCYDEVWVLAQAPSGRWVRHVVHPALLAGDRAPQFDEVDAARSRAASASRVSSSSRSIGLTR